MRHWSPGSVKEVAECGILRGLEKGETTFAGRESLVMLGGLMSD
jgi:hypothetical protein